MTDIPVKALSEIEVKAEVSENDKILILDSVSEEARLASKEELKGDTWAKINSASFSWNDIVFWETDGSTVTLANAKTTLTWPKGEDGKDGTDGQDWAAATITVGTTTTGGAWTSASVTNSWTSSAAVFNFTIPKGDKWDTWSAWSAATITVWSTTTWDAGTSASVVNSGTSSAAVLDFTIPKWDKGDTGSTWATGNGISSITSSKVWKTTTVTITETNWDIDSFTVEDWADGQWSWDVIWPSSATDWNVVLFDWTNWKLIKDSWKTIPTQASDVWALPSSTKYWASLTVSIDSDYKVTTTLKDQDWNTLGTAQVIDLPLESVVVNGSYDSVNKKVILTLQNGNTIEFSVADLVSWLQSEITSSNKLDADLVDDSTSTNKFVTATDKSTWSGKQDALTLPATPTQWNLVVRWADNETLADGGAVPTTPSKATSSALWTIKLWSDTVQSVSAEAVSWTANRTYAIQLNSSDQAVVNVPRTDTTYTTSTWLVPTTWTTDYVLTKTADGYWWAAAAWWDVQVSSQANNILTSWTKIWAWTQANYEALGSYDSNTIYLTI